MGTQELFKELHKLTMKTIDQSLSILFQVRSSIGSLKSTPKTTQAITTSSLTGSMDSGGDRQHPTSCFSRVHGIMCQVKAYLQAHPFRPRPARRQTLLKLQIAFEVNSLLFSVFTCITELYPLPLAVNSWVIICFFQGSVLGLILWNVFFNDLLPQISSTSA